MQSQKAAFSTEQEAHHPAPSDWAADEEGGGGITDMTKTFPPLVLRTYQGDEKTIAGPKTIRLFEITVHKAYLNLLLALQCRESFWLHGTHIIGGKDKFLRETGWRVSEDGIGEQFPRRV